MNPIAERPGVVLEIYHEFFDEPQHREEPQREHEKVEPLSEDAAERLQELFKAEPGFKARLFDPAAVGDRSTVECGLCARLWEAAFDRSEIYAIMDISPQTKWAERDDSYRWSTIEAGIAKAEASHQKKTEEEAAKEAAKRAEPIKLEDVADITYDEKGNIKKVRFSPSFAARVVLERMPLAMAEDSDDIYRFTGQIYMPDGARIIDRALCDAAADLNTADKLKETLRRIKNELLSKPVVFDPNPYLMGVKNGVADLLSGEVRDYRPEDLILDQIPVSFDPAARCPAFLDFLASSAPNISDRITLIDWFVATAIKEPMAYVLFLLGLGRNGKGIYEKLIKKFFGMASFRDMPLAEVGKNNFAAGGFYRKRGWIASETGKKKAAIGTDFIKLTSGNGVIDSDRKNQSRIQFEPYFQTIVDTNTMPKIEDSSIGWQERFVKVDLPYVFVTNPDQKKNPLEKKRDPGLFEKLTTEGELSGILNLVLFRSKAIGKSGQIHKRAGAEMFAEYAEQSSSVSTFLETFCEFVEDGTDFWTPSEPIYEAYKEWCGYKVGEVVDIAYFGKQLKKFCGGLASKQGKDTDRNNIRLYRRLNFDSTKCETALQALRNTMSSSVFSVSSAILQEESEEKSQQITMSLVSSVNLWNEILKRFGNPPKETKNPLENEESNLPKTPKTPKTSASGKLVGEKDTEDNPKTAPKTVGPHPRRDEPTPTKKPVVCSKCGDDLTGHGTVERNGKVFCAKPGCGYPAREAKA